jgi:hypothetical protein
MRESAATISASPEGPSSNTGQSALAEIDAERDALIARRDAAAKLGGAVAPWVGSEVPIDTRERARREYLSSTAALAQLEERETAARVKQRASRHRVATEAQEAARQRRLAHQVALERSWHNLLDAWRGVDEIDAPLKAAGAAVPRHASAAQVDLLQLRMS